MRNCEDIKKIKSRISKPYEIINFLSEYEINYLVSLFDKELLIDNNHNLIVKNTGPITLDLVLYQQDTVIKSLIDKLKVILGKIEITAAFFFKTNYPHIIHNDDTFELPIEVYKGITLPLKVYGNFTEYPKLCFFDQFYFHGPAKFFKDELEIPTYYNKQVYNYKQVDNLSAAPFSLELHKKYFTHLKQQWLEELSFHSALDWIPGNALIFDSTRLHCSSDFRKLSITEKLGISIFTKKQYD